MSEPSRIAPIAPGTRPELAALEAQIVAARGRISPLYQILLNSPALLQGWEPLLTAIRQRCSVPPVLRELVILRVAVLNRAPYEFEAHRPHALAAGLRERAIEAVRDARRVHDWPAAAATDDAARDPASPGTAFVATQRLVLELTDAMTLDIEVPDALYARVQATFDTPAQLDLVATVAAYNMVSRLLVALKIGH